MNLLMPTRIKRSTPSETFRNQLDRLFDDAFSTFGLKPYEETEENKLCISEWRPSIEAFEDEENYTIKAALPGIKKEDIDIQVTENGISISGERKYENKVEKENLYRSEFCYGKFHRSFHLEKTIDTEKVKADYKDGLLAIELPKINVEKEKTKKIKVN